MIPSILHQTWLSGEIPQTLRGYQDGWRRHHPAWVFRLWSDEANASLLADHYPAFLPYYQTVLPWILKVDLVRLAHLHRFGGVYADLDYEPLRPFDPLLNTDHVVVARENRGIGQILRGQDYIINALIAAPAGHPLLLKVMQAMVCSHRPRRWFEPHTAYVIRMAIELLDHQVEMRLISHDDVTVLPYALLYPAMPTERLASRRRRQAESLNAYGVHHYNNSWRSPLARFVNGGRAIIQCCR